MQVDAHGANVALARPVRVPDVRTAASGVLGTAFTGECRGMVLPRDVHGPKRLGSGN